MIFFDTHVVVWLFAEADRIPASVRKRIDEAELFVSPIVRIELSMLAEIGRLTLPAEAFLSALHRDLDLQVEESGWLRCAEIADHLSWTCDPFDRLIVSHAIAFAAPLCTRDRQLRDRYREAFWTTPRPPVRASGCTPVDVKVRVGDDHPAVGQPVTVFFRNAGEPASILAVDAASLARTGWK